MQSDWDSLFFSYRPHADQRPHDAHLLADVGLARTALGELVLADDPTKLVELSRPNRWQRVKSLFRQGFNRLFSADGTAFVRF